MSEPFKLNTEEDFKALPGLRWHLDEDWTPIAKAIPRRFRGDHLYFHGPGILGIYFQRATRLACIYAGRWWAMRCRVLMEGPWGDFDGTVLFRPEKLEDIPREFFRSKSMRSRPQNFVKTSHRTIDLAQEGRSGHG